MTRQSHMQYGPRPFVFGALEFYAAAERASVWSHSAHMRDTTRPVVYLLTHAMELALKAACLAPPIRSHHVAATANDLKRIGHDLSKARMLAESNGLEITPKLSAEQENAFKLADHAQGEHLARYTPYGSSYFPQLEILDDIVCITIVSVHRRLEDGTDRRWSSVTQPVMKRYERIISLRTDVDRLTDVF